MSQPSSIAEYLDALARELAFDPALSRRVRHEVHDHLCEAVDGEAGDAAAGVEQRAIARFGDPRAIAAQYKAVAIYTRTRQVGVIVILAVVGIFLAMEGRVVWYAFVQWPVSGEFQALGAALVPVDRYAFLAAAALAIGGWLYGLSLSIPADHRLVSRERLRRCQYPAVAATLAVAVAVALELLLTGLRLREAGFSSAALLPTVSIVLELGLVGGVAVYLRKTRHRLDCCTADP
jgi:hypothetical protein